MQTTTRRITRTWNDRSLAVTVTTIHPQYGPIRRGTLRLHGGVWQITDGEGLQLDDFDGDYLRAELALLDATAVLDELGPAEAVDLTADRLRAAGVQVVAEGLFRRTPAVRTRRPDYDPNPTLCLAPGQSLPEFFRRYATGLDGWAPGWHRDDLTRMTPGLAHEAQTRRDNDPR